MKFFSSIYSLLRDPTKAKNVAIKKRIPTDLSPLEQAEALKEQGNEFIKEKNIDKAIVAFEKAIKVYPEYAEARVNLAAIYRAQGLLEEAEKMFLEAIALKPNIWQAHFQYGIMLQIAGRNSDALINFRKSLELFPDSAECQWRLGRMLYLTGDTAGADREFRAAMAMDKTAIERIVFTLCIESRRAEAKFACETALKICETPVLYYYFGALTADDLELDTALRYFNRALELQPDFPDVRYNIAYLYLVIGDYENGFANMQERLKLTKQFAWLNEFVAISDFFGEKKHWDGKTGTCKRLLLIPEQGMGDTLMLLRFVPMLKTIKQVEHITVICSTPALASIYKNIPEIDVIKDKSFELEESDFDYLCTTLSLPYYFNTRIDSIPPTPYIPIPATKVAIFAERVNALPGLKIGLVWAGNKFQQKDHLRSIPLKMYAPLFEIPGISWVNLQKGEAVEQIEKGHYSLHDWMDECKDLQDTGALIKNLDLVISVDTAVVHLAGAICQPVWLLNRFESEWRWLLNRDDSPWYSSVRIFRQPKLDDWEGVVQQIAGELRKLVANSPSN